MLNEKHHAFIVVSFFRQLVALHPEEGRALFLLCTRKYAEERGTRMAQRALRDGHPLTLGTYRAYGEWQYTDPDFSASRVITQAPDYRYQVLKCPWNTQFADMDAMDCAELYCSDLDQSLARGFNPDVHFQVRCTMHRGGVCDFTLHEAAHVPQPSAAWPTRLPFSYHCAHLFSTFTRCCVNVYGSRGEAMAEAVKGQFRATYGDPAYKALCALEDINFMSLDPVLPA